MIIQSLTMRQFRCFQERTIPFDGRLIIIQGPNGSGKSSMLEALHYCCYLRSFRTHLNRELMGMGSDYFFVQASFLQEDLGSSDTISVGFSGQDGKVIKYNQKNINSYKELIAHFRLVTLAEDDLALIQGAPEGRRDFLNYALLLNEPGLLPSFKRYRQVLDQRNSMLLTSTYTASELEIWTRTLWHEAAVIRNERIRYLATLQDAVNVLLATYFAQEEIVKVQLVYNARHVKDDHTFEQFWAAYQLQLITEREWRRSLFGIHLDDIAIIFQSKRARAYASRGQQKLIVLLMKIAQLQALSSTGEPGVLLLDDFVTDFDAVKIQRALAAVSDLRFQVILSCPINLQAFVAHIPTADISYISL